MVSVCVCVCVCVSPEFTVPLILKFESFGTRRRVAGCVALDVSKDLSAFTFMFKQSKNCFVLRLLEHEEDYTTILRKGH